jgi:hypothetical protein
MLAERKEWTESQPVGDGNTAHICTEHHLADTRYQYHNWPELDSFLVLDPDEPGLSLDQLYTGSLPTASAFGLAKLGPNPGDPDTGFRRVAACQSDPAGCAPDNRGPPDRRSAASPQHGKHSTSIRHPIRG